MKREENECRSSVPLTSITMRTAVRIGALICFRSIRRR